MSSAKFRDRFVEIRPKGETGGTVLSNGKEATTADDPTKDGEEQEENCDSRPTSASRKQRPSPSQEMSQSPPTLAKAKKPNLDEKETDAAFNHGIAEKREENCDSCPTTASRKRALSPSQQKSQSPPTLAKAKKPNADEKETDAVFIQGIAEKYQLTGNSFSVRRQN